MMHPRRPATLQGALTPRERTARAEIAQERWERPKRRSDCRSGHRPCPYVGCRYHLLCDVTMAGGVTFSWAVDELFEMPETCALDVAERGGATLEAVGAMLRVTRERIRQICNEGIAKIRRSGVEMEAPSPAPEHPLGAAQNMGTDHIGLSRWRSEGIDGLRGPSMAELIKAGALEWAARRSA